MAWKREEGFESIDILALNEATRYKLLMGSIVPRPIAFISTLNEDATANVAPFSAFVSLSAEDCLVGVSIHLRGGNEKSSLKNIRRTREFVINTVSVDLAEAAQMCGEHRTVVNKIEAASLSLIPSETIAPPRIAETRIQFECRLHSIHKFGGGNLVAGQIIKMHVAKGLVSDFKVDITKYEPLGRLGGRNYCLVDKIISV